MSERARDLADRFAQASAEFSAFVERIPEDQWRKAVSEGDPRPVGVVARHVAWAYAFEWEYYQAMADGHPLAPVLEFDSINAEHAEQWRSMPKDEVVAALRSASKAVSDAVGRLSDEQLQRTGSYHVGGPYWTVDQWIDRVLIGHPGWHLREIRTAIEG